MKIPIIAKLTVIFAITAIESINAKVLTTSNTFLVRITSIYVAQTGKYSFANLLNVLAQKGYRTVDIEQGKQLPHFDSIELGSNGNYLEVLSDILSKQNWGCEMNGTALVLYDKQQRASGDAYPLNRKIFLLNLKGVSMDACIQEIGRQLHVNLQVGSGPFMNHNTVRPKFDIQLSNISLRDALFEIVALSHAKTWTVYACSIGESTTYDIFIQ